MHRYEDLIKNESHNTDSQECAGGNDCIGAPPVHNLSSVGAGVPTVGQRWTSVYSSQHLPRPATTGWQFAVTLTR